MDQAHQKLDSLTATLSKLGNVAVAFSGGVDSTFLLKVAHQTLGDKVIALTATSDMYPVRELEEAKAFVAQNGIRSLIYEVDELGIKGFAGNPVNRCYLCKTNLFGVFRRIATEQGFAYLAEGSNVDDQGDYRPGLKAVKEQGVLSPLKDAGLTKADIRQLSQEMGLPTWEKPSFACLASRFPYGETITKDKLRAIDVSEQILFDMGFKQVRVRHHGNLARIEVNPAEMERLMSAGTREDVWAKIKKAGFTYVSVDLQGYRTGSMNETIRP
jgi:uncharacterized protein